MESKGARRGTQKEECVCQGCTRTRKKKTKLISDGARRAAIAAKEPQGIVDVKRRRRILDWVKVTAEHPDWTKKEVADAIGTSVKTLTRDLQYAQQHGLVDFDAPLERLRYEIIPGVIDNLANFVKAKDKTVTLETAKATIFKTYQAEEGIIDGQNNVLALKIEMTGVPSDVKIVEGQVVGVPKELE